jgi:hypothetical protein
MGNRSFNFEIFDKEAAEKIHELKSDSLDELKTKSQEVAEKYDFKQPEEKEQNLTEKTAGNEKENYTHWTDKLKAEKEKQLEPIKDQINAKINESIERIQKEKYPLEREFTPIHEKIMNKVKDLGKERDI